MCAWDLLYARLTEPPPPRPLGTTLPGREEGAGDWRGGTDNKPPEEITHVQKP